MKFRIIFPLLVVSLSAAIYCSFFPQQAIAQGGSNYTVFGLGDVRSSIGANYDAMAGTQIGVPITNGISLANPAVWGIAPLTRLQAGFRFNQSMSESGDASASQNNGKLEGVAALFSVDTAYGFSLGMGLLPTTSVNYSIYNPLQYIGSDGTTLFGQTISTGTGGLSEVYFGASGRPIKQLYVGLAVVGVFGNIISRLQTQIFEQNTFQSDVFRRESIGSSGLRIGALYRPNDVWSFGAAGTLYSDFSVETRLRNFVAVGSELVSDTLYSSTENSFAPNNFGVGASYKTGKFLISADASFSDYSAVALRKGKAEYGLSSRFSVGVSRLGSFAPGTSFGDKINFNFGAGYHIMPYRLGGRNIDDVFAAAGADIPIASDAILSLALTAGQRGSNEEGLILERYLRMTFTFSISETWFQPFARE